MPSDIRTAVARVTIPGGVTGLRDFTGAFSWTPTAALFVLTRAQSDEAVVNTAILGLGATTATDQWAVTQKSETGVSRVDDDGRGMSDECGVLNDLSSGIEGEFGFVAFITGGVRVNIGNGFAGNILVDIIFFGGADIQVHAGSAAVASGATVNITAPGFQPDLVICASLPNISSFDDINRKLFTLGLGVSSTAANPPPQGSISTHEKDAADTSNPAHYVSSTEILRQTFAESSLQGTKIQDYDASGFSFVSSGGITSSVGYLAIKVGDRKVWANNFSTPTATGSFDHTDPNFTPQLVVNFMSMMTALNAHVGAELTDQGTLVGSLGVAIIGTDPTLEALSQTISIEDAIGGRTAKDTQSYAERRIALRDSNGDAGIVGNITSFIGTGWRVNYTAILGSLARRWVGFAIEETGAAGPTQSIVGRTSHKVRGEAGSGRHPTIRLRGAHHVSSDFPITNRVPAFRDGSAYHQNLIEPRWRPTIRQRAVDSQGQLQGRTIRRSTVRVGRCHQPGAGANPTQHRRIPTVRVRHPDHRWP